MGAPAVLTAQIPSQCRPSRPLLGGSLSFTNPHSHLQIRSFFGRSLVVIMNILTWPSWLVLIFIQKIPTFPESKHVENPNSLNTLPFTEHSNCHIILFDVSEMPRTCPQVLKSWMFLYLLTQGSTVKSCRSEDLQSPRSLLDNHKSL